MNLIDSSATLSPLADIERSVRGSRFTLGSNSVVDSFVKVKFAGGLGDIVVGDRSHINSGCVLYSGNGIAIGSDVLVAANCTFAPVNHSYMDAGRAIRLQGFDRSRGGIVVEDDVWIGANSVLLDGVYVERGAVIAAGSVVRGRIEGMCVHAGNPLRIIARRQTQLAETGIVREI